jgi:hypothetical protein
LCKIYYLTIDSLLLDFDRTCQSRKRIPPGISRSLITGADGAVQVLATVWAKSFAVRRAERAAGQGEKHLFAHDVFKQKTTLFIIPDFCLVYGNCAFSGFGIGTLRAEDEVELPGHGDGDGFDAAGAEDLEVAMEGGAEADVVDKFMGATVLDEEIRAAIDGKVAGLMDICGVVDGAGRDRFVELEGISFEVERSDEHIFKGKENGGAGQMEFGGEDGLRDFLSWRGLGWPVTCARVVVVAGRREGQEEIMHVHGNYSLQMTAHTSGMNEIHAAEAKKAAEVRRKLSLSLLAVGGREEDRPGSGEEPRSYPEGGRTADNGEFEHMFSAMA